MAEPPLRCQERLLPGRTGDRTQRIKARLLFIAQRIVEFREHGSHGLAGLAQAHVIAKDRSPLGDEKGNSVCLVWIEQARCNRAECVEMRDWKLGHAFSFFSYFGQVAIFERFVANLAMVASLLHRRVHALRADRTLWLCAPCVYWACTVRLHPQRMAAERRK